jgi:hypothetical protein
MEAALIGLLIHLISTQVTSFHGTPKKFTRIGAEILERTSNLQHSNRSCPEHGIKF